MLSHQLAVNKIRDLPVRNLCDQRVPPGLAAALCIKDIVLLPIRLRAEGLPRGFVKSRATNSPAAVGQVLEIKLAVVGVHWSFQRAAGVETFNKLVAARP